MTLGLFFTRVLVTGILDSESDLIDVMVFLFD
jgi:hypothetical protein